MVALLNFFRPIIPKEGASDNITFHQDGRQPQALVEAERLLSRKTSANDQPYVESSVDNIRRLRVALEADHETKQTERKEVDLPSPKILAIRRPSIAYILKPISNLVGEHPTYQSDITTALCFMDNIDVQLQSYYGSAYAEVEEAAEFRQWMRQNDHLLRQEVANLILANRIPLLSDKTSADQANIMGFVLGVLYLNSKEDGEISLESALIHYSRNACSHDYVNVLDTGRGLSDSPTVSFIEGFNVGLHEKTHLYHNGIRYTAFEGAAGSATRRYGLPVAVADLNPTNLIFGKRDVLSLRRESEFEDFADYIPGEYMSILCMPWFNKSGPLETYPDGPSGKKCIYLISCTALYRESNRSLEKWCERFCREEGIENCEGFTRVIKSVADFMRRPDIESALKARRKGDGLDRQRQAWVDVFDVFAREMTKEFGPPSGQQIPEGFA